MSVFYFKRHIFCLVISLTKLVFSFKCTFLLSYCLVFVVEKVNCETFSSTKLTLHCTGLNGAELAADD